MESPKIDSLIKKVVSESGDFYDSDAMEAKERIWNHVQPQKQSNVLFIRLLAAASIVLFLGLSLIAFSNFRYRNTINALVEENSKLRQPATVEEAVTAASYVKIYDTIYVEKRIVEYKAVQTTVQITDTVYIQQIEYVEREQGLNTLVVKENDFLTDTIYQAIYNNEDSEILISSKETIKSKKRKRTQIKFGGYKGQTNKRALAFTTKL